MSAASGLRPRGLLRDEAGMTTAGMAISLLLTLALVFSTAQVYRINAVASEVQAVADAAALAAANEVAEFMIVVRLCDAVVLTLTLTSLTATGLGVVALCVPATAAASEGLLSAGKEVAKARDAFAQRAAEGLSRLQRALPFLAAANAVSVARANGGTSSTYLAMAVLAPADAEDISVGTSGGVSEAQDAASGQADGIRQRAAEAERAAQRAAEAKERAFMHDCGAQPAYCMYERAGSLASLQGADNPLYSSVDAWSFSVALARAKAYYPARLAQEAPEGQGVEEQARSALRTRFYAFAVRMVSQGYVREGAGSFDALFPRLPKNTEEMRATSLYTEAAYPCTAGEDGGTVMHAWAGCPEAAGASSVGSIAQMEAGAYATCTMCGFTAASLGKVAAASASIDNGFEYHYEAVADAAEEYEAARRAADPLAEEVKGEAGGLLDAVGEALGRAGDMRIDARPPGSLGVVAFVATQGDTSASKGFESSFVAVPGALGTRAAVSAATLVEDPAGEGASVVSSLLDGLEDGGGVLSGAAGAVLDAWSALLGAYAEGQGALEDAVDEGLDGLPLASASGLGTWAAKALRGAVSAAGLEPADLDALKPVLVNSAHVAAADEGAFAARLLSLKKEAIAHPLDSNDAFSSAVSAAEQGALEGIDSFDGQVEIATIEILGEGGPSIPVRISLPPAAKDVAKGAVEWAADAIRSVYSQVTGVVVWE